MAHRPRKTGMFLKFIWMAIITIPGITAIGWSVSPALNTLVAILRYHPVSVPKSYLSDDNQILRIQRSFQKHFSKHKIYIPLEDVFVARKDRNFLKTEAFIMQKACGQGKIWVWIPIRLRLPLIGDSVYEWCWKPKIKMS